LTDDEAFDLLGDATDALRAAGVDVHWPRDLVKALTATAETGQRTAPGSAAGGLLDTEALLDFRWQVSLDGEPLTEAELDALAESRPRTRAPRATLLTAMAPRSLSWWQSQRDLPDELLEAGEGGEGRQAGSGDTGDGSVCLSHAQHYRDG
jgi:hypothetical protein